MKHPRFTLKDLFVSTLVVAIGLGGWEWARGIRWLDAAVLLSLLSMGLIAAGPLFLLVRAFGRD